MQTGLRIDSASSLDGPVGQAVFDRVVHVMVYSRSNPKNCDVGQHAYTGQTNPAATGPKVPGKAIPGSVASKKTSIPAWRVDTPSSQGSVYVRTSRAPSARWSVQAE